MQSYPSTESIASFAKEKDFNVFGPAIENHQKNGGGNATIVDYVSRMYRFPRYFSALSYLSQLNQACCIKTAVEHHRRCMPRTMGSLYWQLNDCWPVASWSSIEFSGRWKALNHAAQKFFAPVMISGFVAGDETPGKGNYITNTMNTVELFTVSDLRTKTAAKVIWELRSLSSNHIVKRGAKSVTLSYGESKCQQHLDFTELLKEKNVRRDRYLRLAVTIKGETVSENTVFFTAPRLMEFSKATPHYTVENTGDGSFVVAFSPKQFHHQVSISVDKAAWLAKENFFDLYPGVTQRVEVTIDTNMSVAEFKKRLQVYSLADSY